MTRKRLFYALSAILAIALAHSQSATAQVSDGSQQEVAIEIGSLPVDDTVGGWVSEQVAAFSRSHPSIAVHVLGLDKERVNKPINALPAMAENVIGISSMADGEVAFLVERGMIEPLDKFLPDPEFSLKDYYSNLFDSVTFEGKVWGVPFSVTEGALVYDWPMFEAAGIRQAPRNWSEFASAAKALTKDTNGDGAIDQVGFEAAMNDLTFLFLAMTLQRGLVVLSDEGFNVDSPIAQDAYEYLRDLYGSKAIRPFPSAMHPGMRLLGALELTKIMANKEMRERYRLALIPTDEKTVVFSTGRVYLGIRKSSPEKEAASWRLVKWLMRKDAPLPGAVALLPPRPDVLKRPDFVAWVKQGCQGSENLPKLCGWTVDSAPHLGKKVYGLQVFRELLNDSIQKDMPASAALPMIAARANAAVVPFKEPTKSAYDIYR